ncbi:MAG: hypothetical protein ACE5OS_05190 [Anaerolineae bacterium]
MKRKWIWFLGGWLMAVSLVACSQVVSPLSVETTSTPQPGAAVGWTATPPATPEPSPTEINLSGGGEPASAPTVTAAVTSTIATATPAQDRPEMFPIYGIIAPSDATPPSTGSPEQYQNEVKEAVIADLAARLEVPVDAIRVVTSGYLEVPLASPCGAAAKDEAGAVGGGLVLGYEVVLEVGSARYRYVALGGLAHYCGAW